MPAHDPLLTRDLLAALPKTDLHVHLDGSLRLPTLIELAQAQTAWRCPSYDRGGPARAGVQGRLREPAGVPAAASSTPSPCCRAESLERVAYELALGQPRRGRALHRGALRAAAARPRRLRRAARCCAAVAGGLRRAQARVSTQPRGRASGREPPFEYGIIVCAHALLQPAHSASTTATTRWRCRRAAAARSSRWPRWSWRAPRWRCATRRPAGRRLRPRRRGGGLPGRRPQRPTSTRTSTS